MVGRIVLTKMLPILFLFVALLAPAGPVPGPAVAAERRALTNGCTASPRGIPGCGAYVGGAYRANGAVKPWERTLGRKIGVRRTYWSPTQVESAVRFAKVDARRKRLAWLSFKAPYSWDDMAAGRGDAWARNLAGRLATVPGPVWVAVHHEPENDGGDIQDWKRMQERLAPIMRKIAPNLGYTVILMGYHQLYGSSRYSLAATWPNTKIDVAGFDIYEEFGMVKDGSLRTEWKQFGRRYFRPLSAWARRKGVAWGLAETGYNHIAAKARPDWPRRTYRKLKKYGGVAFSYFNTDLNSTTSWPLSTRPKVEAFARINRKAVRLR